ncbi:MAG: TolC family protein [Thermodesulfobacteriota bacterium]|nr:TolC family protein [Thermodesulfobacteriota bacterium]
MKKRQGRFLVYLFLCCSLISWTGPVWALTLKDAISIAVKDNPSIKALEEDVGVKELDKKSAFAAMLPTINISYGYLKMNKAQGYETNESYLPVVDEQKPPYYNGDLDTNLFLDSTNAKPVYAYMPAQTMEFSHKDNYDFKVEVMQPIFAGGALFNAYRIADNTMQTANLEQLKGIREIKLKVIQTYYGVIQANQVHEVAQSSVSSIKEHLGIAQALFDQGMIPKNDLLEAQVRYAEGLQNRIKAKNACRLAASGLNILLARNLGAPVDLDIRIPMKRVEKTIEECTYTAMANRQELKTLAIQLDSAQKGLKIANAAFIPQVGASYSYEKKGEKARLEEDATWQAGLGMTWEIFKGGSHFYDRSKTRRVILQTGYIIQAQRDQIALEVKNAYLSADEAMARTKVSAKSIDQAKEHLRIQKDRYNLQVATSSEVLDAEALLTQAETNYISAKIDYAKAVEELKAAMGTL